VYCLESVDLPGDVLIETVRIDASQPPVAVGDAVATRMLAVARTSRRWPYGTASGATETDEVVAESATGVAFDAVLHPYHDWANRGPSAMRVWIPMTATTVSATPGPVPGFDHR